MDAWLARLDSRVLDAWMAYDRVEPISSQWQHTGTMAAAAHNAAAMIAASEGIEIKLVDAADFTPRRGTAQRSHKTRMTGEEVRMVLERRYG